MAEVLRTSAEDEVDPALRARQRRKARRTALLLGLLALALYFGFIAYSVTKGLHGHH
jgi:hypothetical protein